MKKLSTLFLVVGTLLSLNSCSPRISTSLSKNYAGLDKTQEVKVIDLSDDVPVHSELLGEVKVGDSGFTSHCDYETVLEAARQEARKAGGNALKIVKHQYPDVLSSCHRITASIYKVSSFEVPVATATSGDSARQKVQVPELDTIQVVKKGNGWRYKYHGEEIGADKLGNIIQKNAVSAEYMKKVKSSVGFASVLSYAGGFMIGWPIGTAIGGGKPNWTLAAVGCGLVVIAIPVISSANHNILKAVNAYNQEIMTSHKEAYYDIRLGVNSSGLGLAIRF